MVHNGILLIALYTLAWIITLICNIRSIRKWGASSVFYFSLVVYGIFSIIHYSIDQRGVITLFPLIYLYVMFRIISNPIEQYDRKKFLGVLPPRNESLLKGFTIFYLIISLSQVPSIIATISDGISMILIDTSAGAEIYAETKSNQVLYDGVITNITAVFHGVFSPILFLLVFYYLSREKIDSKMVWCLSFCILIDFLSGLAKGLRTNATMMFMSFIITFFAFREFISENVVKYVKYVSIVLGFLVLIPFAAITTSRFADTDKGTSGYLIHYLGQSVTNFDLYALSANGIRNGDRTCNMFKHLLGISGTPKGMEETRMRYSYMKLDDSSFSTIVGDFVLDFGPYGAFLLFLIVSLLFRNATKMKGRYIPFHKMILCYLLMIICMQGGMYLFNFSYKGNLSLIAIFFFYIVFYWDYNAKRV